MHIACIYLSLQALMALKNLYLCLGSSMYLSALLGWVVKEEGQKHPGYNLAEVT